MRFQNGNILHVEYESLDKIEQGWHHISKNDCDEYSRNMLRYVKRATNIKIIEN